MKRSLSMVMCILLCVLLTLLAVCIGAVRGWGSERERTLTVFYQGGAIYDQLDERAMDAANLSVVAARHLPKDDPTLLALLDARRVLINPQSPLLEKAKADAALSAAASAMRDTLPQLASVQASARDQAYISTLTRILAEESTLATDYADRAQAFNQRITNAVTGQLALWLGVDTLAQ